MRQQEDGLGTMMGPEMMIQLRNDAVPYLFGKQKDTHA
jgi:hypothetical protein